MFGLKKLKHKVPSDIVSNAIEYGYDNLEDEEKIELTESILNAYPEVSNIMYEGFDIDDEEEFNYQVLNGEIYERYKNVNKIIESAFNSIVYNTQYEAFRKAFISMFQEEYDAIVVFYASFGWNIDLKQRPQHLAEAMSNERILYIYRTDPNQDREVFSIKQIKENLYLVNLDMDSLNQAFFDVINEVDKPKFVHVYATCLYDVSYEKIKKYYMDKGFKVIYDFVDEISSEISGVTVSTQMIEDHKKLLKDVENVLVVSTAKDLKKTSESIRGSSEKSILVPNGVNLEDFSKTGFSIAKRMKQIVDKGKPIIGYYGALAKWFDYEKVKKLAIKRPDYEVVLIGINYDRSYDRSGLDKLTNVSYLGIINYIDLITYSAFFDVCMVPFIKNDITDATSPVKIFEYMALEKPIVTTDINECKSYESCQIAYNDDDFIDKVDYAVKVLVHDEQYKKILKKEAADNTWKHRAKQIKIALKNFN